MFGNFARGYAFGRVAMSTRKTCEANWRVWVSWRMYAKKGIWLEEEIEEAGMVEALVQYMAFCFTLKKNKGATNAGIWWRSTSTMSSGWACHCP